MISLHFQANFIFKAALCTVCTRLGTLNFFFHFDSIILFSWILWWKKICASLKRAAHEPYSLKKSRIAPLRSHLISSISFSHSILFAKRYLFFARESILFCFFLLNQNWIFLLRVCALDRLKMYSSDKRRFFLCLTPYDLTFLINSWCFACNEFSI